MSAVDATRAHSRPPLVFVAVGTDVHPFDRLMRWIDAWLATTTLEVRCLVQAGHSAPPALASSRTLVPHPEMLSHMQEAVAVVCHAGPATVLDCRASGLVPIVVPRSPRFGEHVDDHQVRFASRLSREGLITVVSEPAALGAQLDDAVRHPAHRRLDAAAHSTDAAIDRFGSLVDDLLRSPRRRRVRS